MELFDFVVVGGGIAGLSAVVRLAGAGRVLCVTKESFAESNTAYAQGGIAVAMGGSEDVSLHLADTIAAGDGLVNAAAAKVLVEQGPRRVEELLGWGTEFDRAVGGELLRTREGAHSLSRILHANGDATGREIARALLKYVQGLKNVELRDWTVTVDLMVEKGRVEGVVLLDKAGTLARVGARAVMIASGGAGQVYSDTTNPAVATGDGIAMAYRAGAAVEDMEFYQFHPTAFAMDGAPRFLMSEALRGEGAVLINAAGERFMPAIHPMAELAPRDVVARAITREGLNGPVYLDMRGVTEIDLKARFPGISAFLAGYGLSLAKDLIPVRPAAHYLMGGIKTDVWGKSSLQGLYAAGEAACTGVHGANRLASNSLLEGLVFGVLAAESMVKEQGSGGKVEAAGEVVKAGGSDEGVEEWIAELRAIMWENAGLLRDSAGLKRGQARLDGMFRRMPRGVTRRQLEARNLYALAGVMVESALGREESRGAHFRSDFPEKGPIARHSVMERGRLRFE
ncbi:L-aspartate oxidase [Granulicella tundricola]|uniref:L-aspartate oxidase n=1 Tax=Granulicella tundricola (strain ATCC BAA-1859 / DSM 23138 / MP5ACTX9) TaxID=1198114 RepID=E8X3L5_GRATM|nr:L-aspartate oxidase [Granulicella tundricola]ADW68206.1 L-aspartate oxidase [Granulicella tundricola MP5ACTX9]